ncbi:MAG: ComEC/Rec2 family competence protein [Rhizobiales bacterium]|nr:ComEC/Rec2 family competence protein [Hyphomicrobiales bacterium]
MSLTMLEADRIVRPPSFPARIADRLQTVMAAQESALFAWLPVCLTAGIWIYFWRETEPSLIAIAAVAALGLALALVWLKHRFPLVLGLCLLLAGICLAKTRTEWVRAPVLPATTGEVLCEGTVERIEARRGNRVSITLRITALTGVAPGHTPSAVKLLAPARPAVEIGDRIKARCRLSPPPAPVSPGGFDYARTLWFEGIGATGRVIGSVEVLDRATSLAGEFQAGLQNLRAAIGERVRARLAGDIGAIGEALITGERAEISRDANTSMQISGLAHVLSISGLHMSLVAGGVFALVRGLLALWPGLVLQWPIKKWAACAALLAGFGYLLLSGSEIATRRSYIMLAIMFIAILIDRPALSTRNLALAALFILAIEPEAAISASFQMSFLAVAGLVSFFDAWYGRGSDEKRVASSVWMTALRLAARMILLAAATTLIAGTLSSIPAIYHFGRASPYSLIANLLAMPVIGFLIMPMAVASVWLMPLELEYWPLTIMGEGIRLMLAISAWVSTLPGARLNLPSVPLPASLLLAAAALVLCLARGRLRFTGLALVPLALVIALYRSEPDILVERTAANVAVRTPEGTLSFASLRRGRFAAEKWLQANGEEAQLSPASDAGAWECGKGLCKAVVRNYRIAYADDELAIRQACPAVDILIARFPLRDRCGEVPVTIDRFDVWRNGSYAVYLGNGRVEQRTARAGQGNRPWTVKPIPRRDLDKEASDTVQ